MNRVTSHFQNRPRRSEPEPKQAFQFGNSGHSVVVIATNQRTAEAKLKLAFPHPLQPYTLERILGRKNDDIFML